MFWVWGLTFGVLLAPFVLLVFFVMVCSFVVPFGRLFVPCFWPRFVLNFRPSLPLLVFYSPLFCPLFRFVVDLFGTAFVFGGHPFAFLFGPFPPFPPYSPLCCSPSGPFFFCLFFPFLARSAPFCHYSVGSLLASLALFLPFYPFVLIFALVLFYYFALVVPLVFWPFLALLDFGTCLPLYTFGALICFIFPFRPLVCRLLTLFCPFWHFLPVFPVLFCSLAAACLFCPVLTI